MGNFFNSEIIGLPTDKPYGVAFVSEFKESITDKRVDRDEIVESVVIKKNDSIPKGGNGRVPVNIYLFFKKGVSKSQADNLSNYTARNILANSLHEHFEATGENTRVNVAEQSDGTLATRISTFAIVRHAAQLYESISCVILFIFLYWLWDRQKENLPPGRLLGIFLIWCFGLRFFFEVLKENQEAFEDSMILNMGQILSIPLVIAGVVILLLSFKKEKQLNS